MRPRARPTRRRAPAAPASVRIAPSGVAGAGALDAQDGVDRRGAKRGRQSVSTSMVGLLRRHSLRERWAASVDHALRRCRCRPSRPVPRDGQPDGNRAGPQRRAGSSPAFRKRKEEPGTVLWPCLGNGSRRPTHGGRARVGRIGRRRCRCRPAECPDPHVVVVEAGAAVGRGLESASQRVDALAALELVVGGDALDDDDAAAARRERPPRQG